LLSASLRGIEYTPWLGLLFSTLILGFGVKAAIVPLHTWLPDAHPEAPSPISALLSGIVIETGLYAMVRVLHLVYEPDFFKMPIALLAVLTMTLANVMALNQSDIKRLLAYSSIAQIGYMLVGLAAGTAYGAMGLFLHVFNHSMMKGMAFLAAGSMVHEAGTRDIKSLRGVGKMMPITSISLFIALLGLGGVPGTNGFISKYHLFSAAFGSGLAWLGIMGVLNSALSMAYYIRIMPGHGHHHSVPRGLAGPHHQLRDRSVRSPSQWALHIHRSGAWLMFDANAINWMLKMVGDMMGGRL
jgi:formate hydrogenlyase subunit 3/multisubunit Na+/H+ antiporter MnhD subunit